jgi:dTDP-glucose 4,6-dehydratase
MTCTLVTGGAGFIGSALVRHLLAKGEHVVCVDALTYAGHLETLAGPMRDPLFQFVQADIRDATAVHRIFKQFAPEKVVHLAAESHVDRSIDNPLEFVTTNVLGTTLLLDTSMRHFEKGDSDLQRKFRFVHISTDEVYGSLGATGVFNEDTPYAPNSPYAASKASSDHFVRAWHKTFGLPAVITHCCNNSGPFQLPEKFLPVVISAAMEGREIPVYGAGENVREWIYVDDHVRALDLIATAGEPGGVYNIGGSSELRNIELAQMVCAVLDTKLGLSKTGPRAQLIRYVTDRPGHDQRYAIDATRMKSELGWTPAVALDDGIGRTIDWYLARQDWCDVVRRSFQGGRQGQRTAQSR